MAGSGRLTCVLAEGEGSAPPAGRAREVASGGDLFRAVAAAERGLARGWGGEGAGGGGGGGLVSGGGGGRTGVGAGLGGAGAAESGAEVIRPGAVSRRGISVAVWERSA